MKNKLTIAIIIVLGLIIAGAAYYIWKQRTQIDDLVLQSELFKEELEDQYNELSIQYEGFMRLEISNDSLVAQLETEQVKVQRLQEELKTVKASNARRITELKKELETLRSIMRGYVAQIDSLDRLNKELLQKNEQVTARYQQATQTVSQLTQERTKLQETVQIASKLDASNITVRGINNKNKTVNRINRMDQLEIQFTINKNITAEPGVKDIYIRIQQPDDNILSKSPGDLFSFENKQINYSAKRTIEYTGEEVSLSIYWKIEEFLQPGNYRVDIFADGNLIGRKSFKLDR